ncbi:GNAT family N-acetyltransferase [Candidatus Uhrbacteria bacterium]|nr:GNAT family N-acetyltransferase [Candidatus Uhrbacteria bacterium]
MLNCIDSSDTKFEAYWNEVLERSSVSPFYTPLVRAYERLVLGARLLREDSFVVVDVAEKDAVAIVPLWLTAEEEIRSYSFLESWHLRAPVFVDEPETKRGRLVRQVVFDRIAVLARAHSAQHHRILMDCSTIMQGNLFYNNLEEFGYRPKTLHGLVLRCDGEEQRIWAHMRSSYKPLINRAQRTYETVVIDATNYTIDQCEEYHILHALAAGRETRPKETFYVMYRMIEHGQAYLVLVRDAGKTVGAYLFYYFNKHAFYASAATHPDYPSRSGIGHLGLWTGIQEARRRGCSYFEFGLVNGGSDKERNIEFFKLGFGGKIVIVFAGEKLLA